MGSQSFFPWHGQLPREGEGAACKTGWTFLLRLAISPKQIQHGYHSSKHNRSCFLYYLQFYWWHCTLINKSSLCKCRNSIDIYWAPTDHLPLTSKGELLGRESSDGWVSDRHEASSAWFTLCSWDSQKLTPGKHPLQYCRSLQYCRNNNVGNICILCYNTTI